MPAFGFEHMPPVYGTSSKEIYIILSILEKVSEAWDGSHTDLWITGHFTICFHKNLQCATFSCWITWHIRFPLCFFKGLRPSNPRQVYGKWVHCWPWFIKHSNYNFCLRTYLLSLLLDLAALKTFLCSRHGCSLHLATLICKLMAISRGKLLSMAVICRKLRLQCAGRWPSMNNSWDCGQGLLHIQMLHAEWAKNGQTQQM